MAIEVGTFEAKNRLSELLAQVEKGQEVYITRRGRRIARLTSATADDGTDIADNLLARFRALRRRAKRGSESIKELIEEGRR